MARISRTSRRRIVIIGASAAILLGGVATWLAPSWGSPLVVVTFKNDLRRQVVVGPCVSYPRCTDTRRHYTDKVDPGKTAQENASGDDIMNSFVVTDVEGRLIGCSYLRWRRVPERSPVVLLSKLSHC